MILTIQFSAEWTSDWQCQLKLNPASGRFATTDPLKGNR